MNPMFSMKWAHAHHSAARLHDRQRQEMHEDFLRTLGLLILAGTVLIMVLAALTLYPDMKLGTGYIINHLNISPTWMPWGTTSN